MLEILRIALIAAGILHFSLLLASLSVPRVLGWKRELEKVEPFTRQIILVHGLFIVLVIIGFGLITLIGTDGLLAGSMLGAAVAGFIGLFWLGRLVIQLGYYTPRRWLTTTFRKVGYQALTLLFLYFAATYLTVAWFNLKALGSY